MHLVQKPRYPKKGWGAEPGSGDRSVHGRQALSHSLGRNSVSRAQSTDRYLHGSSPEQKGDSAQSGVPAVSSREVTAKQCYDRCSFADPFRGRF